MRLLITGATGYLGKHVLRALAGTNQYEIHALYRSVTSLQEFDDLSPLVHWHQIDLLDLPSLIDLFTIQFDMVLHAAAMVSFDRHTRSEVYATNVEGTSYLVDLALSNNCRQFIHISSTIALGGSRDWEITEEDLFPEKPIHVSYAKSKYLAEQEVWRAHAEGLPVTIVSPSFIIGNSPAEKRIIDNLKNGLSYYPLGSNGVVHINDVVSMIMKVINNPKCMDKKFICSAKNMEMMDILQIIAKIHELKSPQRALKPWMVRILKAVAPIIHALHLGLGISTDELEIAQLRLAYNNTLSKELLSMSYLDPFD